MIRKNLATILFFNWCLALKFDGRFYQPAEPMQDEVSNSSRIGWKR